MPSAKTLAPAEPPLAMRSIQGIALPGFFKPRQTLLCLRIPDDDLVLSDFRAFVAHLDVSPAHAVLEDRAAYRKWRDRFLPDTPPPRPGAPVLVAIGFTYQGLRRLMPDAHEMHSEAFKRGLVARSGLLGDPASAKHPGHPANWVVGGLHQELDAMVIVADDLPGSVEGQAADYEAQLCALGVHVHVEHGGLNTDPDALGYEHFGFADGISQPGIRGRSDVAPHPFITRRKVNPASKPACWMQGYPGQDLVWPGEFVAGYPAASPDPLLPGPITDLGPGWTRDGSFLVFRRLRQDVPGFWRTMESEAKRLSHEKQLAAPIDAERLAALLVGRWPDGTPVMRSPDKPIESLAKDAESNNDFLYASTTPFTSPPQALADPLGRTCPLASHIRKVNPRDIATDTGGAADTLARRILRVSVPYGDFIDAADRLQPTRAAIAADRGLLFMSIQASIENQFEFLQARWMNSDLQHGAQADHDMIAGQSVDGRGGERRCTLVGKGLARVEVRSAKTFITPTGGGYFFLPSLPTLKLIAKG